MVISSSGSAPGHGPRIGCGAGLNAEAWLERAVRSALLDSVDEVVVVDDALDNGTLRLARALAEEDDRLTVLALPVSSVAADARLEGTVAASNDWIAPLDSDDYLKS